MPEAEATPTIIATVVGACPGATLSILAKIHYQIHLTVAKALIHNQPMVKVRILKGNIHKRCLS